MKLSNLTHSVILSILVSACQPVALPQAFVAQTQFPQHQAPAAPDLDLPSVGVIDKNLLASEEAAVEFSYQLLPEASKHEPYLSSGSSQVNFPSGRKGVFVALGFVGIARGYQFLYRLESDGARLIDFRQSNVIWGIYGLDSPSLTSIQPTAVFTITEKNKPGQVIQVTGARHDGTGLFANGVFELIRITDEGLDVLFSDLEENIIAGTWEGGTYEKYNFVYEDVDEDGMLEIRKEGEKCGLIGVDSGGKLIDTDCKAVTIIFKYDGSKYKPLVNQN